MNSATKPQGEDDHPSHGAHDTKDDAVNVIESSHDTPEETLAQSAAEDKTDNEGGDTTTTEEDPPEPPYSIFSEPVKVIVIITASFAAIISPMSGSIYFPALPSIAADLDVSISLVTLTVTTYLVSDYCQLPVFPILTLSIDLSRTGTIVHWKLLRYIWAASSLYHLLLHLPCGQYRSSAAGQLRCPLGPSLPSKLRKQWHNRTR